MDDSAFYGEYYTKLASTGNRPIEDLSLKYGDEWNPWLKNYGGFPDDLFDKFNITSIDVDWQVPKFE